MNFFQKYFCSILLVSLLYAAPGWAQEDSLLIHFDLNRSQLRTDAMKAIGSLLVLSQSHQRSGLSLVRIDLSGYCDNIGDDAYNDRLSLRRVNAVRRYLRSAGLAGGLFSGEKGYGKRQPLNDNGDQTKRSLNRRVGIVFFYKKGGSALPATPTKPGNPADDPNKPPPAPLSAKAVPHKAVPSLTLAQFFRDSAQAGKSYILRNLNFVSGRHVLMAYSDTVLKELLRIMLDSPNLKIEIRGHVCCISEWLDGLDIDANTNDLSVRRARFVYEYLRQGGVKASRMSYRGFGASQKLYPQEENEQEQEWNRRVEIKRKNPQD